MNKEKLNNIVEYSDILTNCGARTSFDPRALQSQLKNYKNWQKIILKRHHQFVWAYLNSDFNLKKVKDILGYPIKDLEAILLRVQSQFEMYEENNNIIFKDMYVSIYNKGVFSDNIKEKKKDVIVDVLQDVLFSGIDIEEIEEEIIKESVEEQKEESIEDLKDKDCSYFSDDKQFFEVVIANHLEFIENNSKCGRKPPRKQMIINLIELLSKIDNVEKYKDIFTDTIYNSICLLIKGMNLDDVSKKLKINKCYLTQILVGKENPRCLNEKGTIVFLQEYIDKN